MKAKKSVNITLAIFLGLLLGIAFGLLTPWEETGPEDWRTG